MDLLDKYLNEIQEVVGSYQLGWEAGVRGVMIGAAFWGAVTTLALKHYKQHMSKAAKGCAHKEGIEKKSCIIKFKREALKKQILVFNSAKSKCAQAKNSEECTRKLGNKINKIKAKLGEL